MPFRTSRALYSCKGGVATARQALIVQSFTVLALCATLLYRCEALSCKSLPAIAS